MNDVEVICRYSCRAKLHDLISKMSDSYPSIRITVKGTYSHAQKSIVASMFFRSMKKLSIYFFPMILNQYSGLCHGGLLQPPRQNV